jgi:hypothetical protein
MKAALRCDGCFLYATDQALNTNDLRRSPTGQHGFSIDTRHKDGGWAWNMPNRQPADNSSRRALEESQPITNSPTKGTTAPSELATNTHLERPSARATLELPTAAIPLSARSTGSSKSVLLR